MNEDEREWGVELEGHPFELSELQEELRFEFKHLLCSLVKKDNKYWLKASRFEELPDEKAVRKEAKKFLTTIKALAKSKSEFIDYTTIEIGDSVAGKGVLAMFAKPSPPEPIKFYKKCGMYQSFKSGDTVTEIGPLLHERLREQGALVLERDDDICERVVSLSIKNQSKKHHKKE
jgi:hypothetical protein